MKAKRKIRMGCCNLKQKIKKNDKIKVETIWGSKKKSKHTFRNRRYRSIPIPNQSGGVLPLIPIFAGLSALGSLASGASAVYNTIKNSKKRGSGLYLNPRSGSGLKVRKIEKNKKKTKKKHQIKNAT